MADRSAGCRETPTNTTPASQWPQETSEDPKDKPRGTDERSGGDFSTAFLVGVNLHGLALGTRRVDAADTEQLVGHLDERHLLASPRVDDVLTEVSHCARHYSFRLMSAGSGAGKSRAHSGGGGVWSHHTL
jgi:hypothetical protein